MLSCLPDALSASFWPFLTLKANHIRKSQWVYQENKQAVRQDELYRLVPQLTLIELYLLRYGPLTNTRWCSYGGIVEKKSVLLIFKIFFLLQGQTNPGENDLFALKKNSASFFFFEVNVI
jgi:hypothetical protein